MFLAPIWPQKKHEYKPSLEDLPLRPAHNKNRHKLRPRATHNRRLEGYIKKNVNSKNKVAKKLAGLGFISYLCS